MKKRAFPKDFKFGTYLPKRRGMSFIKTRDCVSSLEQFISEYFSGIAELVRTPMCADADAVYIDGEYTALLFRNVMSAIYGKGGIDISITSTQKSLVLSFSVRDGALEVEDADTLRAIVESARLSGFEVAFAGNTMSFSAHLVRGKLVISALSKETFFKILTRVFFED